MGIQFDIRTDLERRIAECSRELQRLQYLLTALDTYEHAPPKGHPSHQAPAADTMSRHGGNGTGSPDSLTLMERVVHAITALEPKEFTVPMIEDWIREHQGFTVPGKHPRSRIAMLLKQLNDSGEIIRTAKLTGGRPHRYKLSANASQGKSLVEELDLK